MLMRWLLEGLWIASAQELVPRGTTHVIWGLEFSDPPPDLGRSWRLSSIPNGQWPNQLCRGNETSIKTPKQQGLRNILVDEPINVVRRWHSQRVWIGEPMHTHPYLACPMHVSHLTLLSCTFFDNLVNIFKVFSWVLWVVLVNYQTWW